VIGIIAIDRDDERPFDDEARDFVARLADHAAISIENTQLYQAVQRANQAKTEFVSVVTHELRVPMTSIKGYAEMMSMSGNINDQQTRFLDIIMTNVERMNVLVSDLSDVSRIESGRLKLEIDTDINLKEVVEKVVPSMQNEIERREHKVKIDMSDKLPPVKADPQRLAQILTNLVSNAYKYTPNGGTITIKAKKQQDMVRCEVSDSGVGMTQEELARLFTKFWRADNAHVREQPGTGLGLTITKNLVELQGGELDVHSEKGSGTTFGFTLPASK
jgi:signal transduction histidine kinase